VARAIGVVEGLLSGRIAGKDHPALPPIPDCDREHAVESVEAVGAPLFVGPKHDLTVGFAVKGVPLGRELCAKRAEVVDLSVEHSLHTAVSARHGHPAGFRQIDDGEPAVTKRQRPLDPEPRVIGPAMNERVAHALECGRIHRPPVQLPYAKAMELLLTGDLVSAKEALDLGFLNYVVDDDQVLPRALEIAEKIAANGPIAVKAIRQSARACLGLEERAALKLESEISAPVFQTEDAREGPRAFMEKRKPEYKGR